MATLVLAEGTPLARAAVVQLVREAVDLNRVVGNPTTLADPQASAR